MIKTMNLSKSLLDKLIRRKSIWYEKLRGLDFTRTVDSKTLRLDYFEGDVFYAATLSRDLIEVLDVISIPEGSRILDFGAGKGAAMKIMQKYNFLEVAGVEISGDLCKIAQKNFKILGFTDLEIYESDASLFVDIDRFTHFYFFHPFSRDVMKQVLDNILKSVQVFPRKVSLIYYNPGYQDLLDARRELKLEKSFEGWKYRTLVYSYK